MACACFEPFRGSFTRPNELIKKLLVKFLFLKINMPLKTKIFWHNLRISCSTMRRCSHSNLLAYKVYYYSLQITLRPLTISGKCTALFIVVLTFVELYKQTWQTKFRQKPVFVPEPGIPLDCFLLLSSGNYENIVRLYNFTQWHRISAYQRTFSFIDAWFPTKIMYLYHT